MLTTLAIGVHNIPEGLAKATVLVGQGVSARQALLWSVLTCLPQPLVAVPSFLFVEAFTVGGRAGWRGACSLTRSVSCDITARLARFLSKLGWM